MTIYTEERSKLTVIWPLMHSLENQPFADDPDEWIAIHNDDLGAEDPTPEAAIPNSRGRL